MGESFLKILIFFSLPAFSSSTFPPAEGFGWVWEEGEKKKILKKGNE